MAAASIAKLSVLFSSDGRQFDKGIKKSLGSASRQFSAFGKKVATAAAGAGVAIAGIIKSTANAANSLAKTSRKLGLTIDELAGFRHAADQSGVSIQTMDTSLQRAGRRISAAANGTGEARKALEELGLSAKRLNEMPLADAMGEVADAMQKVTNEGDKSRLMMALFDTEGVALKNTFEGGSEGLRKMREEAVALGLSFDEVDARKFEEFNDDIDVMRKQLVGARNVMAVELLPVLQTVVGWFEKMSLAKWTKAFVEGWRWAVASATGHIMAFSATFADFLADVATGVEALLNKFPKIVNGIKTAVQGTINFVIEGVEGLINSVVASINLLNAGISKLPFVGDIEDVENVSLGRVTLPDAEDVAAVAGAYAEVQRDVARGNRQMADDSFAVAKDFKEAMMAAMEPAEKSVDVAKKVAESTAEEITKTGTAAGAATKAAVEDAGGAMDELREQAVETSETVSGAWDSALGDMSSGIEGMIANGRTQWTSFGEWFKSWTASTVANYLAEWAKGMAQRLAMAAATSSTGWISAIGSAIMGPSNSFFGAGNLTGKATGGAVSGGVPYLVGERGPEVVVPGGNSNVIPNHKIGGGSGGIVVNQNFSTGVSEAQLFEATRATYEAAKSGVADAVARGGSYRRRLQF